MQTARRQSRHGLIRAAVLSGADKRRLGDWFEGALALDPESIWEDPRLKRPRRPIRSG